MKTNIIMKMYIAYKPCEFPNSPQFQWNGYGGKNAKYTNIPGIRYHEDEVGFYFTMGELICNAD